MLGSDFESFLTRDGRVIPETVLGLPGKQTVPITLTDEYGPAGFLHRDNVMLEMCSLPSATAEELVTNIQRALHAGKAWLQTQGKEFGISTASSYTFEAWLMQCPQAMEIGCDIDYISDNLISMERERLTVNDIHNSRFSGAHVHISYEDEQMPAWLAACLCDLFIGLPNARSLDLARAPFYGQCTLHRPTQYPDGSSGVEYRPLDNFWIHNTEKCLAVAEGAQKVEQIINLGDVDVIRSLHRIHAELPRLPLLCDLRNDADVMHSVAKAEKVWQGVCNS
jgi:hypothetical protein